MPAGRCLPHGLFSLSLHTAGCNCKSLHALCVHIAASATLLNVYGQLLGIVDCR